MRWTSAQINRSKRLTGKVKKNDLFPAFCKANGLPIPVTEYRFHPVRRWRIDYFFEANGKKIGLEVEGGIWTGGRHTSGAGFMADMEKYNAATSCGILIIRVVPKALFTQNTLELITNLLK